ncbi:MAG: hypothetical protein R3C45_05010 [Phycisphaerales bacterium]
MDLLGEVRGEIAADAGGVDAFEFDLGAFAGEGGGVVDVEVRERAEDSGGVRD